VWKGRALLEGGLLRKRGSLGKKRRSKKGYTLSEPFRKGGRRQKFSMGDVCKNGMKNQGGKIFNHYRGGGVLNGRMKYGKREWEGQHQVGKESR